MFPKIRSIENTFQQMRLFMMVVVVGSLALCGYTVWQSYKAVTHAQSTVYVLNSGKALEAFAEDRRENIPVEARDHIRAFHQYLFTLDPDERQITTTVTKALYLADASAKRFYDNLKESGYYAGIIAGSISQNIIVDSITLDMRTYPFYFQCYATQKIIRPTSQAERGLVTEGWLRNTSRSDNDPHGFMIERWAIVENKDRKVETR
ncbi:MAG TPA: conjugative transposon protein TraK [Puia sp.]|jgi:conjugative transposon TraK protein